VDGVANPGRARGGLFPALLRHWRHRRGLSQLDLASAADVSSRHVSFLETGRSAPSAEMVLRLAAALDVPLRHVNAMLSFQLVVSALRAPLEVALDEIRIEQWFPADEETTRACAALAGP
jgi:transcriptional regulator with XRE-family HTH domain